MQAKNVVQAHLRAAEAGDWATALSFIADEYSLTGIIPFPISLLTVR